MHKNVSMVRTRRPPQSIKSDRQVIFSHYIHVERFLDAHNVEWLRNRTLEIKDVHCISLGIKMEYTHRLTLQLRPKRIRDLEVCFRL